jgi:phage-related protein
VDAIRTFLEDKGGYQAFYWTPPGEVELLPPKKWFQPGDMLYGKTGPDTYSISFNIERVQRP